MSTVIKLKRAYETPSVEDGQRVLVERLWPRGLTKAKAKIDHWLKEISPSPELRKWYSHDVAKWPEFKRRYSAEIRANPEPVRQLRQLAREGSVTLIYAARDKEHNSAVVLRTVLQNPRARK